MAIKEYRVQQANMRPIYRRPVRMVQNLVGDKPDKKEAARLPLAEGQAPIAQQGASPRYDAGSLMGLVSSLRSPGEANTAFDPSKPIGGENVPYKGTSGIGGIFSRFFGNRANELNVEAQQGEAAQMQDKALRDEERTAKREDLAEEIRLREAGPNERFKITQAAAEKAEADRVAAENKRLELEGKRVGLTERQIEEARLDRIERLKGEQADRDARIEDMRTRNALADYTVSQNQLKSNQPQMISLRDGSMGVMNPADGSISIVNPGTAAFGNIPGTPSTTKQVYPQAKAPVNPNPSGGQVDRTTGATLGGPLPADAGAAVTPPRNALMPMDESNRPSQRMVPVQEEESIDPYQLQRTTPSMGTMMEPAGSAARRRARYLSPNMPGWSLSQ
jgi:hypothetical protein